MEIYRQTIILSIVAIVVFTLLVICEQVVYDYEKTEGLNNWNLTYTNYSGKYYIKSAFSKELLIYGLDWGFGNYPNYVVILVYTSILNQRHRSFLHVTMASSCLLMSFIMQLSYGQPLFFNMFPSVFRYNLYTDANGQEISQY